MKKRIDWIDYVRGISMLAVVISHVETKEAAIVFDYTIFPFMLPAFFFVSGYVSKVVETDFFTYFKKRIVKLLITYFLLCLASALFSLNNCRTYIHHPDEFIKTLQFILSGKALWFVACLISADVIIGILMFLSQKRIFVFVLLSTVMTVLGVVCAKPHVHWFYYFDTALICQILVVFGILTRKYQLLEWIKNKWLAAVLSFTIYVGCVIGLDKTKLLHFNIAQNIYGNLFAFFIVACLGAISISYICKCLPKCQILSFVGQHTLLYFAFHGHGLSVCYKIIASLYKLTEWNFLYNPYFFKPFAGIGTLLILIIPSMLIDYFIPIMNGKYHKPIWFNWFKHKENIN